jgi:uncharacterized membrane protein
MGKWTELGVPAGLIALGIVPILAGAVRISQIAGGIVTPENARWLDAPVPGVLHLVGVTVFALLGALQFAPRLRRRWPRFHRWSGRIIVPAGLIAAVSGLWMNQFYQLPPHDGRLLYLMRLTVGLWMFAALVTGYLAIRRRDVSAHQDWMLRGYAIGMGAGTQVLTGLPVILLMGPPGTDLRAALLGLGWAINAVLAEIIIARRHRPRLQTAAG